MSVRIQVTADDISLFHLAARYFDDAMQWWRIAERNVMTDPDLTGFEVPVQIELPSADLIEASGGVPET
ncbi:hypothetical protein ACFFGF_06970 [Asaia lannensis]|uniref:LysM domain-containing protein n=1 Tax=Asaia lannensis NBRC 102526 TaxID=1307926 RepID=A0ABT1CLC0_9PROT|nr:hypothetical protein [Asaia lannensis]MCO6160799.1 hypothetical protein [Asaia lannensis NBRC 102526]GBQ94565.1 hypothetical protein AA102526_0121 [Asaia lannensis NBRC 102526]